MVPRDMLDTKNITLYKTRVISWILKTSVKLIAFAFFPRL